MCDTLVIVEPRRVLFAKNSDRDPNEAQLLDWQPRRRHPPGSRLQATWIEIPQVAETHAVLLSRPFWMWGAEMGTNEHGVTIGNEAVFTREPYAATGLTGMDLLRLALERAATADEAVGVITALLEQFGQGGGCGLEHPRRTYHNSFLVADPRGAFVLETAGRKFAVEPVTGARSISNGLSIAGFAEAHSDRLRTYVAGCALRRGRTQSLARQARGPADLAAILRDHGTGGEIHYSLQRGGLGAPCVHAGGLVASAQTAASWIAELSPDGCRHWATATAAPCTGIFKPIELHAPLDLGPTPTERADTESLWWRHERWHRRAVRDAAVALPRITAQRAAIEDAWFAEPPPAAAAFATADRLLAEWLAVAEAERWVDRRPAFVRRYWRKRNQWAGLA